MSRRQGASYSPHPTYMHSPFVLRTAGKEYETVKLYLSADIEGTAGIDTWDETAHATLTRQDCRVPPG